MEKIFIGIVLGHFVADWCLQPKKMSIRKSEKSWTGIFLCLGHCLIYTASVCLISWHFSPLFAILVFASHFPIDRWSLAGKWLRLIGSRDIRTEFFSKDQLRDVQLSFSCLTYAVADNTMHILLLWLIARYAA